MLVNAFSATLLPCARPRQKPRTHMGCGRRLGSIVVGLSILLCHSATVVDTRFIGDMKAVISQAADGQWRSPVQLTLQTPLAQLTACVDMRVLSPGSWTAFSYGGSQKQRGFELGLQGSGRGLTVWLNRHRHQFHIHLPPAVWHHLCIVWDSVQSVFTLQVNNIIFRKEVNDAAPPIQPGLPLTLGPSTCHRAMAHTELYLLRMWNDTNSHGKCEDGKVVGWKAQTWCEDKMVRDNTLRCGRRRVKRAAPDEILSTILSSKSFLPTSASATPSTVGTTPTPPITDLNPPAQQTVTSEHNTQHSNMVTTSELLLPSTVPSSLPSTVPSSLPSTVPTSLPSTVPTSLPSTVPSSLPSTVPSSLPSTVPSSLPSTVPSSLPSTVPSSLPSTVPSSLPSTVPTSLPSTVPSSLPSTVPSSLPSTVPSSLPSTVPSSLPSTVPTSLPSTVPSSLPSTVPSSLPSTVPSSLPSTVPSSLPSTVPTSLSTVSATTPSQLTWWSRAEVSTGTTPKHADYSSNTVVDMTCNCSAYCSDNAAYYIVELNVNNSNITYHDILTVISKLNSTVLCNSSAVDSSSACVAAANVSKNYQGSNLECQGSQLQPQSCLMLVKLARSVSVCTVSEALLFLFQGSGLIFVPVVYRAAICDPLYGPMMDPLQSNLTFAKINITLSQMCDLGDPSILTCHTGEVLVSFLNEMCSTPVIVNNSTVSTPIASSTPNTTNSSATQESEAQQLLGLTQDASALNSSQVQQVVSQLEGLLSGANISLALGRTAVGVVSNLLNASTSALAPSSSRIIQIVDTVGLKLLVQGNNQTILAEFLALAVKTVNGSSFPPTSFTLSDASSLQIDSSGGLNMSAAAVPQASILLPASLTSSLSRQDQLLASRVQFNFYQKSSVFVDKALGNRSLNSGVLSSSVANLSISGLTDDVVFSLRNKEPIPANFVASCVFWDFTRNNGSGGWNSAGCSVKNTSSEETICSCNHLTSFAVLLEFSNQVISPIQEEILTFITYIGCGISCIFLSITLLTYLSFEKLRKDIPSKILIQLCLALLLLNLVFLLDAWLALYTNTPGLCISTAFFLHYFLLTSFTWMGLEAFHMYLALVKVFNTYVSRYMLKFCLIGWGIPLIVVAIVMAISRDNYGLVSYGRFPSGSMDEFCWIKNDVAFYVAVVAYFCLVFLLNLAMFVVVLVQLCRIKRQNPQNTQHRSVLQDVRSITGLTFLLGLTWGFAFFAWGPVNLAFMYLFAIFNSLQGFFIFVFHCAVKDNVRRQWRTYLCCGKLRLMEPSEWSRTATKQNKIRSRTTVASSHSSNSTQSNNASSSASFLRYESPEPPTGFGNPSDDQTITALEDPSSDVVLNELHSRARAHQASGRH